MAEKWMQAARNKMEKKGTVGSFTKAAKRAGMSTAAYQKQVLANPKASTKMKRKAAFRKAAVSGGK